MEAVKHPIPPSMVTTFRRFVSGSWRAAEAKSNHDILPLFVRCYFLKKKFSVSNHKQYESSAVDATRKTDFPREMLEKCTQIKSQTIDKA